MKKNVLLIFCALLLPLTSFAGGGWTQPKGKGFYLLSHRIISGKQYFNRDGKVVKSPLLTAMTTNIYAEYGYTDKLTLGLYSPFMTMLAVDGGVDENGNTFVKDDAIGFGDLDLSLKYKVWEKNVNIAAEVIFGIPTGDYNAGETGQLHLGDDEFNQLINIHASKGFSKGIFASVFVGFNNRTNGFSDEIHYGGEIGITKKKWTAILKIYGRKSTFNEERKDTKVPGLYSDNLEYFSFSPQLLYQATEKLGFMAEMGMAGGSRNIIAAPSLTAGVYLKL